MEGSNFNKLELAKMFRKTKKTRKKMKLLAKPKVNAVGANKEYQIGQLTFTTGRLDWTHTHNHKSQGTHVCVRSNRSSRPTPVSTYPRTVIKPR